MLFVLTQSLALLISNQVVPITTVISLVCTLIYFFTANPKIHFGTFFLISLFLLLSWYPFGGRAISVASLINFAAIYLPSSLGQSQIVRKKISLGIVYATVIGCILSVVQAGMQKNVKFFIDPVANILNANLIPGYNRRYFVESLGIYKPNGVFFLEPSFFSIYCALSLILLNEMFLAKKKQTTILKILLSIGLVQSFAVSGISIIVIYYILKVIFERRESQILSQNLVTILTILAGSLIFSFISTRLFEYRNSNSSFSLRITLPYKIFANAIRENFLFGRGFGTVYQDAYLQYYTGQTLFSQVQRPTIIRLLLEVGIIGFVLFLSIILSIYRNRHSWTAFGWTLLVIFLIPTDGLLTPSIALLVVWLVGPSLKLSRKDSEIAQVSK